MAEPSYEELKAKVAELEKKGAGRRTGALEFRVGEKGGVSVYGLGRFPVTLYYEQWIRLLDASKAGICSRFHLRTTRLKVKLTNEARFDSRAKSKPGVGPLPRLKRGFSV